MTESWARFKPTRRTDPPTVYPYLGYRAVDATFNAREAISDIIDRVERDYPTGTLNPLVDLIDAFNALESVHTTHTAAFHQIGKKSRLLTSLIVMPRAEPGKCAWWTKQEVEDSAELFSQRLGDAFNCPLPAGRMTFGVGGIEVLIDAAEARTSGYGMEFQIDARGRTVKEVLDVWEWPVCALGEHARSMVAG